VTPAAWSRVGGSDCIRLAGLATGADVRVFPGTSAPADGLPPMAGQLVPDGPDLCFVPRFPFVAGTPYAVTVAGAGAAVLTRPRPGQPGGTRVAGIYPTAAEVPVNLLRLYVWFSAPMSEGLAGRQVRLARDDGSVLAGALRPAEEELWDAARRRLTVLLDPARIKRGLPGHDAEGYPLSPGEPFRLIVGSGFLDAQGLPLQAPAQRRYHVSGEERRHVSPGDWGLTVPALGTAQPLRVSFDRPLDHGLLRRCLRVTGPDGRPVAGTPRIGHEERSWQLTPDRAWARGDHQLIVDPVLEDLAGNSVSRVFDRDLDRPEDQPRLARPVTVSFRPGSLSSGVPPMSAADLRAEQDHYVDTEERFDAYGKAADPGSAQ
jgi:hypothetical protein